MNLPEKLSLIIPIYNVEDYLPKCLNSILDQTYSNLEIIVVNDGSTDGSDKICDEYAKKDKRIKVIHQNNAGLSNARNRGLDIATGTYIGFIDSDDWVDEKMYENMMTLAKNEDADIVACGLKHIFPESIQSKNSDSIVFYDQENALLDLLTEGNLRFEVWNKIYKHEIIRDIRFKLGQIHEDLYFTSQVFFNATKIIYIDKPYYNYLKNRNGNTNSSFKENRLMIFSEFDDLVQELKSRGMEENAQHAEILSIIYALSFYKMARENPNTSLEIIQRIIAEFNQQYVKAKANPFFSEIKWKADLFHFNPGLYWRLTKLRKIM